VHLLNVADGNFPSEFSTAPGTDRGGAAAALRGDDARENRARLIARSSIRDAAVAHGRPARLWREKPFLTREVMACLEPLAWAKPIRKRARPGKTGVNVAEKLRSLWS